MLLDSDHLTKCVRALAGIAAIQRAAAVVSSSIGGGDDGSRPGWWCSSSETISEVTH